MECRRTGVVACGGYVEKALVGFRRWFRGWRKVLMGSGLMSLVVKNLNLERH